jgi:HK97 gp10 family phage protein
LTELRISWDEAALARLGEDRQVLAAVRDAAEGMAAEVANRAPRDTGAAAGSIAARPDRGGQFRAGWDAEHGYLIFPEFGTRTQPPQRFARDVLDRYTYT